MAKIRIFIQSSSIEAQAIHQLNRAIAGKQKTTISDPCVLRRVLDLANERGKDVEAESDAGPIWVTVKGYPKGTAKTHPSTQAGHWFKKALFDIIVWRGDNLTAELALALPDFPRYRKLATRVAWFQWVARFSFMWVQEDGIVDEDAGQYEKEASL